MIIKKKIKKEVLKEPDTERKDHYITDKHSKFKPLFWREKWRLKFKPSISLIVYMELLNGDHADWVIAEKDGGFRYRNKRYIFDDVSKYYSTTSKMWCYDFHEGFALPIKRIIPIDNIKKAVEASRLTDIEHSTNPSTLDRFLKAEIAKGIMQGAGLSAFLQQLRILIIIAVIIGIVHLLLYAQKSGVFEKVGSII